MSKKKNHKKHKTVKAAKTVSAPLKVVEITVPKEEPAPEAAPCSTEEPARRKSSVWSVLLKTAAVVASGLLLLWTAAFFLRRQPLSTAYSLNISTGSFVFRVGDEGDISFFFKQATDIPFLLRLQEKKLEGIQFESSDESVVAVDDKGHLSAVGSGVADVIVRVEDMSETVQVVSYNRGSALVFPETSYEMNVGGRLSLKAQAVPEDAVLYEEISYSLSDENVLSFDEEGLLRAYHPGTCVVRAEAEGLVTEAEIRVLEPMAGISFIEARKQSVNEMERGGRLAFPVRVWPEDTTDSREMTYRLSDPEAGEILPGGVFVAEKAGRFILTVECNGFTDQAEIEVFVSLRGVQLDHHEKTLVYQQKDQLSYQTVPKDTTDEVQAVWASENPAVVTVDQNGLVTAAGPGSAGVTVDVNGFTDRCVYNVQVPVTGVSISAGKISLKQGQTYRLSASVVPSFTTESRGITWRSDNPGIASVDANGVVKAVNSGNARIYAVHGSYSASCQVSVYVPTPRSVIAERIISFGRQYLGTRYVYGGNSLTGGIDCSSFTMQCFATQGIRLPRVSYQQAQCGYALPMDMSQWLPGDLVFYAPHGYVSHVAIYIGNGQILQSAESMGGVCITSVYYNGFKPCSARRVF